MTWQTSHLHKAIRSESKSENKGLKKKLKTGPENLILGEDVKDVKVKCHKNTKILSWVIDMTGRILHIAATHSSVKDIMTIMLWNNSLKCWKKTSLISSTQSALWMRRCLQVALCHQSGTEHRNLALNTWFSTVASVYWQFNFLWDHRHLFKAYGLCLNKSGVKLFISILFCFLHHPSVPSVKGKRQGKSKQEEEDVTKHGRNLEREPPQPAGESH